MPIKPDDPFEHLCSNGVRAVASRCDLKGGVTLHVPRDATEVQIAEGSARVFGYHAGVVLPELPSFPGYDAVRIKIVRA